MENGHNPIDTPPIQEKANLYMKTEKLLDSAETELITVAELADGTQAYGLLLRKETAPGGTLRLSGFLDVSVARHEAYSYEGADYPETTYLTAYKEVGSGEPSMYMIRVDEGYPEISPYDPTKPRWQTSERPITKDEGLDVRSILMGLEQEV